MGSFDRAKCERLIPVLHNEFRRYDAEMLESALAEIDRLTGLLSEAGDTRRAIADVEGTLSNGAARIRQLEAAIAAPAVREWSPERHHSTYDSSEYIDGWNDALDEIRRGLDLPEPTKTSPLPTTNNKE